MKKEKKGMMMQQHAKGGHTIAEGHKVTEEECDHINWHTHLPTSSPDELEGDYMATSDGFYIDDEF